MKKLLVISPHFPPRNSPDMQRLRMSLPHYRAHGWEPVVLTLKHEPHGVHEPALLATVPSDIRVIRLAAIPAGIARRLGFGDPGLRALPSLLWHGGRLLQRERFDLVFFTNTQFATFPLGRIWRALFGVPYVIDIQDPWRTDHYERPGSRRPPGGWKYQFARLQARLLEGWTYRRAGGFMSVSPDYLADIRARYAGVADIPAAVIRFGASRLDLALASRDMGRAPEFPRAAGEIHFVYTGASGPVMPHALTVLFEALGRFRALAPAAAARLRFHFVGTSYVAPGTGVPSVLPLAASHGVEDLVREIPHRIGHLEAMRWQLQADVLLLPGSSDRAYSPSKLYPYFMTGRPILGLVFRQSVLEQLLEELNCAHLVRITEGEKNDDASTRLARFFASALEGFSDLPPPPRDQAAFERQYLAESLTAMQCRLFDRVAAGPEPLDRTP